MQRKFIFRFIEYSISLIRDYWFIFCIFSFLMITFLSLWPLPKLPEVAGGDKTHHVIAYFVLMFPLALRKPGNYLLITLLFLMWGIVIELVQPYVNRHGEFLDMIANISGILLAWILAFILNKVLVENE